MMEDMLAESVTSNDVKKKGKKNSKKEAKLHEKSQKEK
jgi:hypothetical protein